MKPRPKPQDSGTQKLFRAKLWNIIILQHELVGLVKLIDWGRLEMHFAAYDLQRIAGSRRFQSSATAPLPAKHSLLARFFLRPADHTMSAHSRRCLNLYSKMIF